MQIQINDHHHQLADALRTHIEDSVEDALAPHAQRLTRVEIHVQDLNASKGGVDKRCLIEARPRGLDPLVAEHEATSAQEAFRGALEKIERVLEHRFDKLAARDRGRSE